MILGHRIIGTKELCYVLASKEGCSRLARNRHRRNRDENSLNRLSRLIRNRNEGSNILSRLSQPNRLIHNRELR